MQAINELADLFYDFLPNKAHPRADSSISIQGVASDLGLANQYAGGSKRPAITTLLQRTLEYDGRRFCPLVLTIVQRGMIYRNNKGPALQREDIEDVNTALKKAGFKIPELIDPAFLDSLPRRAVKKNPPSRSEVTKSTLNELRKQLVGLSELSDTQRGPAFERFLRSMFSKLKLDPRGSFKLVGEQIDGSFDLDGQTYLVEAKFHATPVGPGFLREFRDKVDGKASWSRGLFVSWSGFSPEAAEAMARGKSTNIVGFTGQDLFHVLEGGISLANAVRLKARHAAETGGFFVSVQQLLLETSV